MSLSQHPLPPQSTASLESMYSLPGASHASVSAPPAGYSSEHPQSAPGRRTPLGAVGLGGFYFQQQPQPHASSSALSDENRPDQERLDTRYWIRYYFVTWIDLIQPRKYIYQSQSDIIVDPGHRDWTARQNRRPRAKGKACD